MQPKRIASLAALLSFGIPPQTPGQSGPNALRFEVASIRPFDDKSDVVPIGGVRIAGRRVDMIDVPMSSSLISQAFQTSPFLIIGAPNQSRWTIHALMPEGATQDQLPEMLKAMLEERFHLRVHRETRRINGYDLLTAPDGAKLKPPRQLDRSVCSPWIIPEDATTANETCTIAGPDGRVRLRASTVGGGVVSTLEDGVSREEHLGIAMPELAKFLTTEFTMGSLRTHGGLLQHVPQPDDYVPVTDRTGLGGQFALTVNLDFAKPSSESDLTSQLQKVGLRLEKTKVAVDVIVVDHLDNLPTDN